MLGVRGNDALEDEGCSCNGLKANNPDAIFGTVNTITGNENR